ncbi:MAG: sel1 repeat family protein, partial [Chitinophagaceae bacterium]
PAIIALGNLYRDGDAVAYDPALALQYYGKAIKLGSIDALWQLGGLYEDKLNKIDSAIYWYKQAADKNYHWAMSSLGRIHFVKKEFQQALQWFNKGADLKNSSCMYFKAMIYENGYGVPVDMIAAKSWYRSAAALGHNLANKRLKELDANENPPRNQNTDWDEY